MTREKPGGTWYPESNMTNSMWYLRPAVAIEDVMTVERVMGAVGNLKSIRNLCGQAAELQIPRTETQTQTEDNKTRFH